MAVTRGASPGLVLVLLGTGLWVGLASPVVPCDLHGRWNTQQDEFQSAKVSRVTCALSGNHIVVGPGGMLSAGEVCPTAEQRGEPPVTPTPFLQTTYRVLSVPVPVSRTPPEGIDSAGCVCFYLTTTDNEEVNEKLQQGKEFFGNQFASMCIRFQRTVNTLVTKTDFFKVDSLAVEAASCPASVEWGPDDNGHSRYRSVRTAVGPLYRSSNSTIVYDGVLSSDASAHFPTTSLVEIPACMAVEGDGSGGGGNTSAAALESCTSTREQRNVALGAAAALALVLIASWFGCCVMVWHAKQQPKAREASVVRTTVSMVLVAMFLHIFSVALILPALTPLVVDDIFGGSTASASVFLTAVHVVASILEFVSNPLVGAVSDDRGRKNFLLVSLLATAVSLLAIGIAPSKFTIAVSGALRGLTAVSITMGNAMIVDMSKLGKPGGDARPRMAGGQRGDQQAAAVQVRDRGSSGSTRSGTDDTAGVTVAPDAGDDATQRQDVTVNLGLLLAAAALSLMCGPIIGGVLSLVSLRAPFVLAAVVEVVNMVFVRGLVPETLQRRTYFTWSAANPLRLGHMLFKTPVLRSGTLILILVNVGLAVYSQAALWTQLRFDWKALDLGFFLTFIGLLAGTTIAVASKVMVPKWGDYRVLIAALAFGVVQMLLLGLSTHSWMWYLVLLFTSLTFVAPTALRGIITKQVPRHMQGKIQGLIGSVNTATGGLGPVLASALFVAGVGHEDNVDGHPRGEVDLGAALCFVVAALLFVVALVTGFVLYKRHGAAQEADRNARHDSGAHERFIAMSPMAGAAGAGGVSGAGAAVAGKGGTGPAIGTGVGAAYHVPQASYGAPQFQESMAAPAPATAAVVDTEAPVVVAASSGGAAPAAESLSVGADGAGTEPPSSAMDDGKPGEPAMIDSAATGATAGPQFQPAPGV